MLEISGMDKVVTWIRKIYKCHKPLVIFSAGSVDVLMIAYFAKFIPFISLTTWGIAHENLWARLYSLVDPYTTGSYILGVLVLLQFIMLDSTIIKLILGIFYTTIIFFSFVAVIEMVNLTELSFLLPHIVILIICIVVSVTEQRPEAGNCHISGK